MHRILIKRSLARTAARLCSAALLVGCSSSTGTGGLDAGAFLGPQGTGSGGDLGASGAFGTGAAGGTGASGSENGGAFGSGGAISNSGGFGGISSGGSGQSSGGDLGAGAGASVGGASSGGGDASGSGGSTNTGGSNSGGANSGGSNTGGSNSGGADSGGSNSGGADSGGATNTGGTTNTGGAETGGSTNTGGSSGNCTTPPAPSPLIGWASVSGSGVSTTTGGEGGNTVPVSNLSDLNTAAGGTTAEIIQVTGTISGNVTIGSNKTIVGLCGASIHGHIQMSGSVNVIVRNIQVVGNNCTDSPSDCSNGADAITVERDAHHLWFDHDDILDGSDGNLDITHASDFVTISWTKFHYSAPRTDPGGAAGGHEFSNLIGHSDSNASEDTGHLNVTFHHVWWGDNSHERMPRVRFGKVHLFNNLYTATGDLYCVGVGVSANILSENNVFSGVSDVFDTSNVQTDSSSVLETKGDSFIDGTSGETGSVGGGAAFSPPYSYTPDSVGSVESEVMAGAGPQ